MQYPNLTGPVGQNDAIKSDFPDQFAGNYPDRPNLWWTLQSSIVPPFEAIQLFSQEMVQGYNAGRPNLFNTRSQVLSPIDLGPYPVILSFSPEMAQGASALRPVLFNTRSQSINPIEDPIPADVISTQYPALPRLFLAPRIAWPDSQVAHQPDTSCKAEEIQGNYPAQPHLFTRNSRDGLTVWISDIVAVQIPTMTPEMFSGNHPDSPRLFLGPRIPLPIPDNLKFDPNPLQENMFFGSGPLRSPVNNVHVLNVPGAFGPDVASSKVLDEGLFEPNIQQVSSVKIHIGRT